MNPTTTEQLNEGCNKLREEDHAFFERAFSEMNPPADIRKAAERIVCSYGIRGICDPGYIANIIALETGRGDGKSTFFAGVHNPTSHNAVSMTTKTKIEAHLRQLAPHHRERASARLLIEAKEEIDRLRKVIGDLMPFVLEDYYPSCATVPFKAAVEAAIAESQNK